MKISLFSLPSIDWNKLALTLFPYRKRSSDFFGEFIPEGGEKGTQGLVSSDPKTSLLGLLANSKNDRNKNHQASSQYNILYNRSNSIEE